MQPQQQYPTGCMLTIVEQFSDALFTGQFPTVHHRFHDAGLGIVIGAGEHLDDCIPVVLCALKTQRDGLVMIRGADCLGIVGHLIAQGGEHGIEIIGDHLGLVKRSPIGKDRRVFGTQCAQAPDHFRGIAPCRQGILDAVGKNLLHEEWSIETIDGVKSNKNVRIGGRLRLLLAHRCAPATPVNAAATRMTGLPVAV